MKLNLIFESMSMIHDSNVSGPATSCSSMPPGISDQATTSSKLSSFSDQTTTSLTSSSVSQPAANCCRQTREISSVQHVESHEMREYLQVVSADEDADYLRAIDNDTGYLRAVDSDTCYIRAVDNDLGYLRAVDSDADYLRVVGDNYATVDDETSYSRLDGVESHSEPGCPQQGYHPLTEDGYTYEEIADAQLNNMQAVNTDCSYESVSNDEQNQAQVTSTSETSFNTTAETHELQQAAVYELTHNEEPTGISNRTKRRLLILLLLLAAAGAVLIACLVVTYFSVKPSSANTNEAFGLMRTQQYLPTIKGLLAFDSVIRNVISESVNLTSSSFVAPQTASPNLYWMIIAVEVPINTPARVKLTNTYLMFNKSHSVNSDKDIITKSGLVQLESANVVTVQSDYVVNKAYWSGFCLNSIMQSVVGIFVASSKQLTSSDPEGLTKIAYDTVIINKGKAWNTRNNAFVAPQSGIYVFSISIGFTSPDNPVAVLGVSTWSHRQNFTVGEAGMGQEISSDIDFISTSRVLHLLEDATVEGMFIRAESIYSDSATLVTSLSAFLYSPTSNKQVVWSVAISTDGFMHQQFKNPLPYDYVRLNIGGAWLPSHNAVVITTPGIYYVFVAINVCGKNLATLWLQVNGKRLLEIKSTTAIGREQTRSNGAVIRLATGDELTVEVVDVSDTCLCGSSNGVNSFLGLLLTTASV